MLNFLDYQGPVGPVSGAAVNAALQLMGLGMLGIFLVMLLLCLVVVILNRVTGKNKDDSGKTDKG
jgi:Na+-transporting methylmalonyl-CoA/oxaloacetate decarboxylase gamma subunit